MNKPTTEENIHIVFIVSLVLKALNALLETALGLLFLFTGAVSGIIIFLTKQELIEDPSDFLANHIRNLLPYVSTHSQLFAAFYLLSHGVIKLFLVWGLLRNKLWAYPASMVFLTAFIVYQVIRFNFTHSLFLVFLTLFDLIVLWLVWHEYNYLKRI